ncbi:hypothetical protein ACFX11_034752 [Malus domestica]
MTVISQLKASSSRHAKIPTSPKIPAWVNKFANPLPGQPPVVVEGAYGTFTMENGVTKVSISLYSNFYMESRVLIGKLVGKHRWYAIEFTDEEELEFALDNRPGVWISISRVPVQYRDAEILEAITQLVDTFVHTDETSLSGLNGLFVRVLMEVDLRLPLKRILVVNDDEECPLLLSYKKLFEICFYCGSKMSDKHLCPADFDNDGCLLMDRIVKDETLVCLANFPVSDETKSELHEGVMLLFPQPTLVDEIGFDEVKQW